MAAQRQNNSQAGQCIKIEGAKEEEDETGKAKDSLGHFSVAMLNVNKVERKIVSDIFHLPAAKTIDTKWSNEEDPKVLVDQQLQKLRRVHRGVIQDGYEMEQMENRQGQGRAKQEKFYPISDNSLNWYREGYQPVMYEDVQRARLLDPN